MTFTAKDFIETKQELEKYGITMTSEDIQGWCLGGENVIVNAKEIARQIAEYEGITK